MCLSTIDYTEPDPKVTGYGWKVYGRTKSGELLPDYFGPRGYGDFQPLPIDQWLPRAHHHRRRPPLPYRTGYHVFKTRKDARAWKLGLSDTVRKVKWRGLLAAGSQTGRAVTVAAYVIFT